VSRSRPAALALAGVLATAGLGGCATGCPAALQPGVLVTDGPASLGLRDPSGHLFHVRWPLGVGVRRHDDRLALTDAFGSVIAHEGDPVSLPGGTTDDDTWGVCGAIQIDGRAQP
jgi:hypothetical protein